MKKEYQHIYTNQCVDCPLEGTYHCKLIIEDCECKTPQKKNKNNGE